MKITFGKVAVIVLSVLILPFICAYAKVLWGLLDAINLGSPYSSAFVWSFLAMAFITLFFISSHNFFTILNHELTHNLWAVLSFSKPKTLQVRDGKGGNFAFSGRKNIMTVLSPYFFPLITAFIFPLYFIINGRFMPYYFAVLGLSFGFSLVTELKQIHLGQPDLRIYGLVPSFIMIIFFQIIIIGFFAAFLSGRMDGVGNFFVSGFNEVVGWFRQFIK